MPETKSCLKVFLSYASQDKPVVQELSRRLIDEGWIDAWLDVKKLLPGQDWRVKIEEAVEDSDIVIICLSSNSVTKEGYVQKELRYAREIALEKPEETIFLVPLRLDECDVPRGLRFYQWVDYYGEKKDESYSALIESLQLRYEQKVMLEETERAQKEKQERELAERVVREKKERENAEKIAQDKAAREKAEKNAVERVRLVAEEMARQKAVREKNEREMAEKETRERAKKETEEKAKLEAEEQSRQKLIKEKSDFEGSIKMMPATQNYIPYNYTLRKATFSDRLLSLLENKKLSVLLTWTFISICAEIYLVINLDTLFAIVAAVLFISMGVFIYVAPDEKF